MGTFKSVGIKNLKNDLSAYLQEVKRGVKIFVTDRDQVIAEIREPSLPSFSPFPERSQNVVLASWIQEAKIRPPLHPKGKCPVSPLQFSSPTAQRLIDADRGQ